MTARPALSPPFGARPFAPHPRSSFPHSQRFFPHPERFSPHSRPFFPHPFLFRPFVPWGGVVVYATPVVAAPTVPDVSPIYSEPAPYFPSTMYGASTNVPSSVAPPPVTTPSVIEYPSGRYELRGDGITTPYTWVWLPNPPPAPPAGPPGSAMPSGPRHSKIYRWIDGDGVVHLTDNLEGVPDRYRSPTK